MAEPVQATLARAVRDDLAHAGHLRQYRTREVVFHQGDPCDSLFLLQVGRVGVQVLTPEGEAVTVGIVAAPEAFGEMGLLRADHHHSATVIALDDVSVLTVRARAFDEVRVRHPELSDWLLRLLITRLERMSVLLAEALFVDADRRVYRRLLDCHAAYGMCTAGVVPLRQEDVAAMAGVSRPTANRALRRLKDAGAIDLHRCKIAVLDLAAVQVAAR